MRIVDEHGYPYDDYEEQPQKTQYDRIRNMDIEEMARLLLSLCGARFCDDCPLVSGCGVDYGGNRVSSWVSWLESEVADNE